MIGGIHARGNTGVAGVGEAGIDRRDIEAVGRRLHEPFETRKMVYILKIPAGQGIERYNDKMSVIHKKTPFKGRQRYIVKYTGFLGRFPQTFCKSLVEW